MSELVSIAKTFQYKCDKCDIGYLYYTGRDFEVFPVEYEHKCDRCDHKEVFLVQYPRVQWIKDSVDI